MLLLCDWYTVWCHFSFHSCRTIFLSTFDIQASKTFSPEVVEWAAICNAMFQKVPCRKGSSDNGECVHIKEWVLKRKECILKVNTYTSKDDFSLGRQTCYDFTAHSIQNIFAFRFPGSRLLKKYILSCILPIAKVKCFAFSNPFPNKLLVSTT